MNPMTLTTQYMPSSGALKVSNQLENNEVNS